MLSHVSDCRYATLASPTLTQTLTQTSLCLTVATLCLPTPTQKNTQKPCDICPAGAFCPGGILDDAFSLDGYWREPLTGKFYQCLDKLCLRGRTGTSIANSSFSSCRIGHRGVLCALCEARARKRYAPAVTLASCTVAVHTQSLTGSRCSAASDRGGEHLVDS